MCHGIILVVVDENNRDICWYGISGGWPIKGLVLSADKN